MSSSKSRFPKVSPKVIERLSLYRRLLQPLLISGDTSIFSHQLARLSGGTAAQVRQDLRVIGYSGSTNGGYNLPNLIQSIDDFFGPCRNQGSVLVGLGNLGLALLAHFSLRNLNLVINAAFDNDPEKVGKVYQGCRCFDIGELPTIVREQCAKVGILTVPEHSAAEVTELMVENGITGILNFSPVRLSVPDGVFVDNVDLTMAMEKVLFFAAK